jgi:dihydrolipoamide dehydrogenase
MTNQESFDVAVIGAGPGGYSGAFLAADQGLSVCLIERYDTLGGVCLNVGCIPSKALLHVAEVIHEAKHLNQCGVTMSQPKINLDTLRKHKNDIVKQLTGGLAALAKQRKVTVIQGEAQFASPNSLTVQTTDKKTKTIHFKSAIIAAGSRSVSLPFIPEDKRIIDSTGALELPTNKGHLLVLGGGIIGCEMATVYNALGMKVTVVEMAKQIMPGADPDIVAPCQKMMAQRGIEFKLGTKVTQVKATKASLEVLLEGDQATKTAQKFDLMLVCVGRKPNGDQIGCEQAGINVNEQGFIKVDQYLRTNVPHIHAIGDICVGDFCGDPMLAHKAVPQGHLAAEVIAGKKHRFDARCIACVAYTDPEVAWVGLTETQAKAQGIAYETATFPWLANGRSLALGRKEGLTKLLVCSQTKHILGAAIVGTSAGDLISEVALAIEMGCDVEDLALTIHPHPTLSETVMLAAEMITGSITDLLIKKKKKT